MLPSPGSTDSGQPTDSALPIDTADSGTPLPDAPALYPDTTIHSPLTPAVAEAWRGWTGETGQADVFMKVGASSTVSTRTLHCFADPDETDLGAHSALSDALVFFRSGDAAGDTPFDRETEAAKSGVSAAWPLDGDPTPLQVELDAISPRYAIVHYGTNDMGLGSSYDSAMPGLYRNMTALLDALEDEGVLPILTGISPRGDSTAADAWVETVNAIIRGLAQDRQLPFIDLHRATRQLDDHGLSSDGIHLNGYSDGACILTEDGLEFGYNVRNLIVLQALSRVYQAVVLKEDGGEDADTLTGNGDIHAPLSIPGLPFTDSRSTADSPYSRIDAYTGCDYDADESGPEWTYTLTLDEPTALRAMVLDGSEVDVDLHILSGTEAKDCHLRADRTIETTLPAGTWTFVLDTYVSEAQAWPGEYLFVVQPCDADDTDCQ